MGIRFAGAAGALLLFVLPLVACTDDDVTKTPRADVTGTPAPRDEPTRRPRSEASASPTSTATATFAPTASATATAMATETAVATEPLPGDPELSFPSTESDSTAALLFDRKVVQNGSMLIEVVDVRQTFRDILVRIETYGGYVAESSVGREKDYEIASVTARVPVTKFGQFAADVQGLAVDVRDQQTSSEDVTQDYVDMESRLSSLKAVEDQYLVLLGEAQDIKQILTVQDRLNRTRAEIEQTQGRLNALKNLTDFSTLRVDIRPQAAFATPTPRPTPVNTPTPLPPTAEPEDSVGDSASKAWDRSFDLIEGVARVITVGVVFFWWLPVPCIVALVAWRVVVRRNQRAVSPTE